jgi:hypothetical protein
MLWRSIRATFDNVFRLGGFPDRKLQNALENRR